MTFRASDKILIRESVPLPKTPGEIGKLLVELEEGGPVQRIVAEVGRPALVWRWMDDGSQTELSLPDSMLRNSKVLLLENERPECPEELLVQLHHVVSVNGKFPTFWAVGADSYLSAWLPYEKWGIKGDATSLLGLPLVLVRGLPPETLLLAAADSPGADVQDINFAVKTTMEARNVKGRSRTDGGGRARPGNGASGVQELGSAGGEGIAGAGDGPTLNDP